ncbi:hypothetical protein OBBRIDRAFT_828452 [Obba rivulosa]|uniref:Uncharacterized protein n=1 Tax=Obba rivulosa TaxID=1052685 RepID=A0A8E2AQL3_9APHY|nr:hypothetical protein OBBRIDRAFT_828452 [Obba rivulosa]
MSSSEPPKRGRDAGNPKNRNPKTFIDDKDAALQLARTIAEIQEDKSQQKAGKHQHQAQTSALSSTNKKDKTSKRKMEKVKASIATEIARAKREKFKKRKKAKETAMNPGPQTSSQLKAAAAPAQKRVTFG